MACPDRTTRPATSKQTQRRIIVHPSSSPSTTLLHGPAKTTRAWRPCETGALTLARPGGKPTRHVRVRRRCTRFAVAPDPLARGARLLPRRGLRPVLQLPQRLGQGAGERNAAASRLVGPLAGGHRVHRALHAVARRTERHAHARPEAPLPARPVPHARLWPVVRGGRLAAARHHGGAGLHRPDLRHPGRRPLPARDGPLAALGRGRRRLLRHAGDRAAGPGRR